MLLSQKMRQIPWGCSYLQAKIGPYYRKNRGSAASRRPNKTVLISICQNYSLNLKLLLFYIVFKGVIQRKTVGDIKKLSKHIQKV